MDGGSRALRRSVVGERLRHVPVAAAQSALPPSHRVNALSAYAQWLGAGDWAHDSGVAGVRPACRWWRDAATGTRRIPTDARTVSRCAILGTTRRDGRVVDCDGLENRRLKGPGVR